MNENKKNNNIFVKHLEYLLRNNIPLTFCCNKIPKIKNSKTITAIELTNKNFKNYLRSSILIKIKQLKKIYEGEIISLKLKNYIFEINLKSQKGQKRIKLKKEMYFNILSENLKVGDIVHIEPEINFIRKLGRNFEKFEFDLENEKKLEIPHQIEKIRIFNYKITFDEIDFYFFSKNVKNNDNVLKMNNILKTDNLILNFIKKNLAEIETQILFISDSEEIDKNILLEILSLAESCKFMPILVFVSENMEFFSDEIFEGILKVKI